MSERVRWYFIYWPELHVFSYDVYTGLNVKFLFLYPNYFVLLYKLCVSMLRVKLTAAVLQFLIDVLINNNKQAEQD